MFLSMVVEAVIFRNPGGHVAPTVQGLLALDHLLGGISEVMVIHHTGVYCSLAQTKQENDKMLQTVEQTFTPTKKSYKV